MVRYSIAVAGEGAECFVGEFESEAAAEAWYLDNFAIVRAFVPATARRVPTL